jgi:hypothetical protein
MFIHIHSLNMFRASLCPSSGEQDYYRIRCSALQQKEHMWGVLCGVVCCNHNWNIYSACRWISPGDFGRCLPVCPSDLVFGGGGGFECACVRLSFREYKVWGIDGYCSGCSVPVLSRGKYRLCGFWKEFIVDIVHNCLCWELLREVGTRAVFTIWRLLFD